MYSSSTPTEQAAFKSAVRSDLASIAGVSLSEVEIITIRQGSIVADFEIRARSLVGVEAAVQSSTAASFASSTWYVESQGWCETAPCDLGVSVAGGPGDGDDLGGSSNVGAIVGGRVAVVVVVAAVCCFCKYR